MEDVKVVKTEDHVELPTTATNGSPLQLNTLPGIWLNTNRASRGIVKVVTTLHGSKLRIRVFGASDPEPCDWGEVEAEALYANNISSHLAAGFIARYRFDFSETHLQANWNQGLLVLATFTYFKDGSKRSNYFSREFFRPKK
jgi:hypothetical protein